MHTMHTMNTRCTQCTCMLCVYGSIILDMNRLYRIAYHIPHTTYHTRYITYTHMHIYDTRRTRPMNYINEHTHNVLCRDHAQPVTLEHARSLSPHGTRPAPLLHTLDPAIQTCCRHQHDAGRMTLKASEKEINMVLSHVWQYT